MFFYSGSEVHPEKKDTCWEHTHKQVQGYVTKLRCQMEVYPTLDRDQPDEWIWLAEEFVFQLDKRLNKHISEQIEWREAFLPKSYKHKDDVSLL